MKTDLFLKFACIAAIVVALVVGGAFFKMKVLDKMSLDTEPPPPPPPATTTSPNPVLPLPAPTIDLGQASDAAEISMTRLNVLGVVAAVLDIRNRPELAARTRAAMRQAESSLSIQLGMIKAAGGQPPEKEHLRADDRIVKFRTLLLAELDREDADRMVTGFLKHLHAGSKAPVEVTRHQKTLSVEIAVRLMPGDWVELIAPVFVITEAADEPDRPPPPLGPPIARPLTVEQAQAFEILFTAKRRARGDELMLATYEFGRLAETSGMSAGSYGAVRLFLEAGDIRLGVKDDVLRQYFQSQNIATVEQFTAAQHAAAAAHLADHASFDGAVLLAVGHVADAVRRQGAIDAGIRALTGRLGLQPVDGSAAFGRPADAAALSLAFYIRQRQPAAAASAYARKYAALKDAKLDAVGAYAELLAAVQKGQYDFGAVYAAITKRWRACTRMDDAETLQILSDAVRRIAECEGCKGSGKQGASQCSSCRGTCWRASASVTSLDDVLARTACSRCAGRGTLIQGGAWRCERCGGLGYTLVRK